MGYRHVKEEGHSCKPRHAPTAPAATPADTQNPSFKDGHIRYKLGAMNKVSTAELKAHMGRYHAPTAPMAHLRRIKGLRPKSGVEGVDILLQDRQRR